MAESRRPRTPAILLTGVGKRYDIVACFAALTTTIAVDPNPLAPAQYAAQVRVAAPPIEDPGYVPALQELCAEHDVGAVIPLTDLDIEILARARENRTPPALPALVPSPEVARATYDKYETHLLLGRLGLPSPPTVLPGERPESYPVVVKPRRGSGARSIHLARDAAQMRFFVDYVQEPVMVQRAMGGPELSIDCLGDLQGRCLNAIPRTMLESRGGESIKGTVVADPELIELGRRAMEALRVRGPATIQVFRDPEVGLGITDVNTRFGGAFPAPIYAALPGRSYPELIVRMAAGETVDPHVGEFRAGATFTRYYWQLELDARLAPTGREIVPQGAACSALSAAGLESSSSEHIAGRFAARARVRAAVRVRADRSPGQESPPPSPPGRICANCDAPVGADQRWCMQCGAAQPGSIGERPSWRALTTLTLVATFLVAGAAVAGAAALSGKGATTKPTVVVVARVPTPVTPGATAPGAPTPVTPTTPALPGKPPTPGGTTTKTPPAGSSGSSAGNFLFPSSTTKPPKVPAPASTPKPPTPTGSTTTPSETGSSTTNTTTESKPTGSTQAEQPTPILLDTDAASTYNPYHYPEANFGDPALAIDREASTAWTAQVIPSAAPRMAQGLLIDLKSPTRLGSVKIQTATPGMTAQIFGAGAAKAPTSITDQGWTQLSSAHVLKKTQRLKLNTDGKQYRFVVVWLIKAPGGPAAPGRPLPG